MIGRPGKLVIKLQVGNKVAIKKKKYNQKITNQILPRNNAMG